MKSELISLAMRDFSEFLIDLKEKFPLKKRYLIRFTDISFISTDIIVNQ